jgi:hypothetical protein
LTNKEKSYKERQNEQERGKKRFLERIAQEEEATKEIKQYKKEEETFPEREDH